MKRIAIIMEGGLIQNILADEEVDITIVDYDTEGAEEEDFTPIVHRHPNIIALHHTDRSSERLNLGMAKIDWPPDIGYSNLP